ncbi:hypothetical protein DL96DRAFT_1524300 [Flagelloscypha sp. PMI_526]|nr:hypothetical protein DL96DRAFT_1524300 [Flagelloscypha sp. PMI_526]
MRVLIFGGTSPTGQESVHAFFKAYPGSTAVIYARTPSKLDKSIASHPAITVVQGQLAEIDKLETCFNEPIDAVVSTLGPSTFRFPGTPIADFYRSLIPLLAKHNVKRLITLTTPSFEDPRDKFSLGFWLLVGIVRFLVPAAYREVRAMAQVVIDEGNKYQIDWTIGRVAILTDKPKSVWKEVKAGYVGDGKTSIFIARNAIGEWWISQIESKEWVGKVPYVSN